jgi:tRNA pseudouridine13 synthase
MVFKVYRFTDFLVYEVDLDGNIIHIKSLSPPESSPKDVSTFVSTPSEGVTAGETFLPSQGTDFVADADESVGTGAEDNSAVQKRQYEGNSKDHQSGGEPWPDHFESALTPFLSPDAIAEVKKMFLEGPEPPRVTDSGWGGRQTKASEDVANPSSSDVHLNDEASRGEFETSEKHQRDKRDRGGRSGRGGRGGGRGGRPSGGKEDHRKVLSDVRLSSILTIIILLRCESNLMDLHSRSLQKLFGLHFMKPFVSYLGASLTLRPIILLPLPMMALGL